MARQSMVAAAPETGAPPLNPGEIEVRAMVRLTSTFK
jgi:hypothetical protein